MERNLVVFARLHTGRARIGLSVGGGGTGPDSICEDATCSPEHQDGLMRNNLIAHCSDVGIYLNEGTRSKLYFNTIYDTAGIDVRYAASTAEVRANLVTGALRDRDGGTHTASDNLTDVGNAMFAQWFADPENLDFTLTGGTTSVVDLVTPLPEVTDDYCGQVRGPDPHDRGGVEYKVARPCDTTVTHPEGGTNPGADGGVLDEDGGGGGADDGDGGDRGCCDSAPAHGSFVLAMLTLAMLVRRRRRA
jgi:uncharacterized protein (TIGR03382 family)